MILPIDQGIEHGPLNFSANPPAKDPEYQWRLAHELGADVIKLNVPRKGEEDAQRPLEDALELTAQIRDLLRRFPT